MSGPKGQKDYGGKAIGPSTKLSAEKRAETITNLVKNFLNTGKRTQEEAETIESLIGAKGSKGATNKAAAKEINNLVEQQLQDPATQKMMQKLALSPGKAKKAIKATLSLNKSPEELEALHNKLGGDAIKGNLTQQPAISSQKSAIFRQAPRGVVALSAADQAKINNLADTAMDVDTNNKPVVDINDIRTQAVPIINDLHTELEQTGALRGALLTLPAQGKYAVVGDNHGHKDTVSLLNHLQERLDNDPNFNIIFAGDILMTKGDASVATGKQYACEAAIRAIIPFLAKNKGRVFMVVGNHEAEGAAAYEAKNAQTPQERNDWERRGGDQSAMAELVQNLQMRDNGATAAALIKKMPLMIQIGDGQKSPRRIISHAMLDYPPPTKAEIESMSYEDRLDETIGGKIFKGKGTPTAQNIDNLDSAIGPTEFILGHIGLYKIEGFVNSGKSIAEKQSGAQYVLRGNNSSSRAIYTNGCDSGAGYYEFDATSAAPGNFVTIDSILQKDPQKAARERDRFHQIAEAD